MFKTRSNKLERIDTGDYTESEYDRFLEDIKKVNRFAGDNRALQKTLLSRIRNENLGRFSVLDVGAGSGELLRTISGFARLERRNANLTGLELNERAARSIRHQSAGFGEIRAIQGNALDLPFADASFDFVISSLFFHHLKNEQVVRALKEMSRVARAALYVIDLHRHPGALLLYKAFCVAFRISPLVRQDGSLSILRGFIPDEIEGFAESAGLLDVSVIRVMPYRIVLSGK